MKLWACTSLMLFFASTAQATINAVVLTDDQSRYVFSAYRTAGVDNVTVGAEMHPTPNIDAMAAAGTRFDLFHVPPTCSPMRAELFSGRFVNRTSNGIGQAKDGTSPPTNVVELDVGAPNMWNMAVAAGSGTAHIGKWHLGLTGKRGVFGGQTMLQAMGIEYAEAIVQRNTNTVNPITSAEYVALTGFSADCPGHRSTVRTHNDGSVYITSDFSTDVEFDALEAYIAWWDTNMPSKDLLITVGVTASHGPWEDGDGTGCAGGGGQDDRPPSPWGDGDSDDKVYYDQVAYMDVRIGLLRTILAGLSNHNSRLIVVGDNGTPNSRNFPPEIKASKGSKNTPYPFGVFVPLIIEGFDIEVGVVTGLFATPDLTATIAELIGARVPHRDGTSFAACLREENGLTAAACPSRDSVSGSRWGPLGGVAGTIDRRPIVSDGAGVWDFIEEWTYTFLPDGVFRLLARFRDVSDGDLAYREEFWFVDLGTSDEYLPTINDEIAFNLAGEDDLVEADWVNPPATADELTSLSVGHARLQQLLSRDGDSPSSRSPAGR